jgi:hypothetical protein
MHKKIPVADIEIDSETASILSISKSRYSEIKFLNFVLGVSPASSSPSTLAYSFNCVFIASSKAIMPLLKGALAHIQANNGVALHFFYIAPVICPPELKRMSVQYR